MRVLLISGEYPPHMFGGGATFMYHLSRGLANRGLDVTVVSMKFSKRFGRKVDAEEHGPRLRVLRVSIPTHLYPRHEVFQIVARPFITELLQEHDLIHMNTGLYYPFLRDVIRESRKPAIVTIHGDPVLVYKASLKLSHSPTETVYGLLHMSEAHTALTRELTELYPVFVSKSLLEAMKSKYRVTRYSVIYNGIDYEYIDKALVSNPKTELYRIIAHAKKHGYKILVYPARLHPIKNHLTLIKVLRILIKNYNSKVLLVLVGDGLAKHSIVKLASKLGVSKHIIMTGRLPYDETLRTLAQADVVPYTSLYEAHPLSIMEALILGKPIIAFNLPYAREIRDICISFDHPFYIKLVNSVKEFINELLNALHYNKLSNHDREIIDKFDVRYMTNSYIKLYEKVITFPKTSIL